MYEAIGTMETSLKENHMKSLYKRASHGVVRGLLSNYTYTWVCFPTAFQLELSKLTALAENCHPKLCRTRLQLKIIWIN